MSEVVHSAGTSRRFVTDVRVRWSDLDAFGHVNNARTLTLLEEARVDWLFTEADRAGASDLTNGIVVAEMRTRYRAPIGFGPAVTVAMWLSRLGAGSATVEYEARVGDTLAVDASTVLVPVDGRTFRPRRWSPAERLFLGEYVAASA